MTRAENNKLIAEFMGLEKIPNTIGTEKGIADGYMHPRYGAPFSADGLPYYWSWDCLMPVVEKIEGLSREILNSYFWPPDGHGNNDFTIFRVPDIQDLHHEVVQFIQWYNEQQS